MTETSTAAAYQAEKGVGIPQLPVTRPFVPPGHAEPTPKDILGPFYRPGSPFRTTLCALPDLTITGRVMDTAGRPLDAAYVEFWQANAAGNYDADGPGFRGIQRCGPGGIYRVETTRPGAYDISEPDDTEPHEFRCSHLHVKVWSGGRDVLTTQLYFPGADHNETDHWFSSGRVIHFAPGRPDAGTFDLVVPSHP